VFGKVSETRSVWLPQKALKLFILLILYGTIFDDYFYYCTCILADEIRGFE